MCVVQTINNRFVFNIKHWSIIGNVGLLIPVNVFTFSPEYWAIIKQRVFPNESTLSTSCCGSLDEKLQTLSYRDSRAANVQSSFSFTVMYVSLIDPIFLSSSRRLLLAPVLPTMARTIEPCIPHFMSDCTFCRLVRLVRSQSIFIHHGAPPVHWVLVSRFEIIHIWAHREGGQRKISLQDSSVAPLHGNL